MAYTAINLIVPGKALAGEVVTAQVEITNLQDYTLYAIPVLNVDGYILEGSYETIVPRQTKVWTFTFTMLSKSVTLRADSWCESYYFTWHLDATISQVISLELLPEFQDFSIREYYKV